MLNKTIESAQMVTELLEKQREGFSFPLQPLTNQELHVDSVVFPRYLGYASTTLWFLMKYTIPLTDSEGNETEDCNQFSTICIPKLYMSSVANNDETLSEFIVQYCPIPNEITTMEEFTHQLNEFHLSPQSLAPNNDDTKSHHQNKKMCFDFSQWIEVKGTVGSISNEEHCKVMNHSVQQVKFFEVNFQDPFSKTASSPSLILYPNQQYIMIFTLPSSPMFFEYHNSLKEQKDGVFQFSNAAFSNSHPKLSISKPLFAPAFRFFYYIVTRETLFTNHFMKNMPPLSSPLPTGSNEGNSDFHESISSSSPIDASPTSSVYTYSSISAKSRKNYLDVQFCFDDCQSF